MAEEKKAEAPGEAATPVPVAPIEGPKMVMGMPLPTFLVVLLNVLVMAGGFAYITYLKLVFKKPAITDSMVVAEIQKKVQAPEAADASGKLFTEIFSQMTINLRSVPGSKIHYATIDVALACRSEACVQALKDSKAKIEDTIQTIIADRTYTDLNSLETKARVKFDIQQKVNSFLKNQPITDVFFDNFTVQ